jgi:pyrroloquinoline quinone biosynthesis protein B
VLIRVLGSAAGGRFPQWNCGCANCAGVRAGTIAARRRTETSIAVSADGDRWVLLDVSPDVREQIDAFPALHPRERRDTPIAALVLTSGDLDHCLGLLVLRESQALAVWTTEPVRRGFVEGNTLARTLDRFPGHVVWQPLVPGREVRVAGLKIAPVAAPGKVPIHLEGRTAADPADNVGLRVRDERTGGGVAYFPGVARLDAAVAGALAGADCVLFDGTFWSSDELPALGLGARRAEQMGHVPVAESLATLAEVRAPARFFVHVNNTNPMLREDSAERAAVRAAGWEVAHDGLEVRA